MQIRSATSSDAQAIAEVHVQTWQHAYSEILPAEFLAKLSVARRRSMWAESIEKNVPHVLVVEVEGQVVGFSAVGPCRDEGSTKDTYELWAIYLSPHYWSKGIGLQLWLASRRHAIERGASCLSLWVIAKNSRAIDFYRSVGFEVLDNSLQPFELGGIQVEEVRYVQQLGGSQETPSK
jgi:ribosomal protein S18 acetylase RimI-like enzyme